MWTYNYSNELYHHGVKGMKWGVRRYRNSDGSLTPEGEKRYYNSDGSLTKAGKYARDSRQLSYKTMHEHLEKLHNSKEKKADDPNVNYFDVRATKGKRYVKTLIRQIKDGQVTSFVENTKGQIVYGAKTKKGVVVRDKDGNRVTMGDYNRAQQHIWKTNRRRINTGTWG